MKGPVGGRTRGGATLLLLPMLIVGPLEILLSSALAWLFTLLFARWVLRRISGFTGDVYGALCELVEATVLLAWAGMGG